jgi:plastocyanin
MPTFTVVRYRKGAVLPAIVSLAILLAACDAGASQSASPDQTADSPSATPTGTPTTPAEPSQAPSPSLTADISTVIIRNRSFGAPEITVAVGDVTFFNEDTLPHTVSEGENGEAFPNARFDEFVDVGDSVTVTFAEPGDYLITCLFHSEMHLLVHAR